MLRVLLVLLVAWSTAGCYVASVAGLADSFAPVFDEALVGRWRSAEDDIGLELARDEWRTYAVTLNDRTGEQRFTGRLVAVAGVHLFDLTIHAGTESDPVLLPVHIIGRVAVSDGTLVVELLDYEWFRNRMKRGGLTLPVAVDDRETVLITASRDRLRRWFTANAGTPGLFSEIFTLQREEEKP
jgi:hypothetical protein